MADRKHVGLALLAASVLVSLHQWLTHGDWFEIRDVLNHEVAIVVLAVIGIMFIVQNVR